MRALRAVPCPNQTYEQTQVTSGVCRWDAALQVWEQSSSSILWASGTGLLQVSGCLMKTHVLLCWRPWISLVRVYPRLSINVTSSSLSEHCGSGWMAEFSDHIRTLLWGLSYGEEISMSRGRWLQLGWESSLCAQAGAEGKVQLTHSGVRLGLRWRVSISRVRCHSPVWLRLLEASGQVTAPRVSHQAVT